MANTLHMTDHALMKLEKHYTCWIERRWHIYPFPKAGYRPLSVQCLISTKIVKINYGSGGSDVGM